MKYIFKECTCKNRRGEDVTIPEGLHSVGDDTKFEWIDIILDPPNPCITISIEKQTFEKLKEDGFVKPFNL
ncbi:hypothetical protein [Marinicella sp. W31]|uniref:hypothetical protein n=1 Tax=Marinicella sp. W31 TaxID=3023713 RepID=UPI0037567323